MFEGSLVNAYGDEKVIDGCAVFGCLNLHGTPFSSEKTVKAISHMHVRGNGLGGGFAVYGLYPNHKDHYALHIMYQSREAKRETESFLADSFDIVEDEEIPTRDNGRVCDPPILWRYFVVPRTEPRFHDDYVVRKMTALNSGERGAFVFSSGKDTGVFKGVGFAEDIADFYRLEEYKGYLWTAHSRFPTNTPGWWGGAHPFSILDWSVVHNGEISSYGTNKRFLESYGYRCTLQTDTEVMAYALDLLVRRHKLPLDVAAKVLSPPFWSQIDLMGQEERSFYTTIRQVYASLLMNGPFAVIVARRGEMAGLTDRIRLRPLTAGVTKDALYLSSEEAAIRIVCPEVERVWSPKGGDPVIGRVGQKTVESERTVSIRVRA